MLRVSTNRDPSTAYLVFAGVRFVDPEVVAHKSMDMVVLACNQMTIRSTEQEISHCLMGGVVWVPNNVANGVEHSG